LRLALVNPPRFKGLKVIREDRCEITERDSILPPVSLLQIAAVLRSRDHEISLLDANGFDLDLDGVAKWLNQNPGIEAVIIRFTPTTFKSDVQVLSEAKKMNHDIRTIGLCWTLRSQSQEVLRLCPDLDVYVTGDSLECATEVIEALDHDRPIRNGSNIVSVRSNTAMKLSSENHHGIRLEDVGIPAYDLLPSLDPYYANTRYRTPYTIIYSSKGCPFGCRYCTVARTRVDFRSPSSVLSEIDYLVKSYGLRSFTFFDETFTLDRKRAEDICTLLEKREYGLSWFCNTRSDLLDPKLLASMRRAGCEGISLGVESGSQLVLDACAKGTTVERNYDAIRDAKRADLRVFASFILGLPGENRETIKDTNAFIRRARPNGIEINLAVPYPGTSLYESMLKENPSLERLDWEELLQDSPPVSLSSIDLGELADQRVRLYRSLYLNPIYLVENVLGILRTPAEVPLAMRFYWKTMRNLFIHSMSRAH
jgi:anaerobic magnesium-protoporphyrin IX monomethyl ester cyclase